MITPNSIGPHFAHRTASDRSYSLIVGGDDGNENFPSPYEGCGTTKKCFGHPANCVSTQNCEIFVGVFVRNEVFVFELFGTRKFRVEVLPILNLLF